MILLAVAVLVIALIGMVATGIVLFAHTRRDKRRAAQEIAVAKSAHEYLAHYKIRGRTIAATLPDDSIAVYATAADPGTVVVAYRRPWRPDGSPASRAALKKVEALLDGIAREALGLRK